MTAAYAWPATQRNRLSPETSSADTASTHSCAGNVAAPTPQLFIFKPAQTEQEHRLPQFCKAIQLQKYMKVYAMSKAMQKSTASTMEQQQAVGLPVGLQLRCSMSDQISRAFSHAPPSAAALMAAV